MKDTVYYFLLFIIYSFMGWFYESALCSVREKRIINRGFLNGPICPVYGSGAVLVVFFLGDITDMLKVFVIGILLTGVLEYLTSYVLEKLFNAKWWDYSERRFNIKGRVCLLGAFVFGCMSVLLVFYLNPIINGLLFKVNYKVLYLSSLAIFIIIFTDFCLTVNSLLDLNERLYKIQTAINKYLENSKEKGSTLKERFKDSFIEMFEESEYYSEKIKKMLTLKKFQDKRILTAFPHFKSTKYHEAFAKFKETMKKNR